MMANLRIPLKAGNFLTVYATTVLFAQEGLWSMELIALAITEVSMFLFRSLSYLTQFFATV
jgi:hypothetical protein